MFYHSNTKETRTEEKRGCVFNWFSNVPFHKTKKSPHLTPISQCFLIPKEIILSLHVKAFSNVH